jgi:hypothetical protein
MKPVFCGIKRKKNGQSQLKVSGCASFKWMLIILNKKLQVD